MWLYKRGLVKKREPRSEVQCEKRAHTGQDWWEERPLGCQSYDVLAVNLLWPRPHVRYDHTLTSKMKSVAQKDGQYELTN